MLLHIYKNLFIQMLRRAGYSKKQAKTIYARFIVELKRAKFLESSLGVVGRKGMNAVSLSGGFLWSETKQGLQYWADVHYYLHMKGF